MLGSSFEGIEDKGQTNFQIKFKPENLLFFFQSEIYIERKGLRFKEKKRKKNIKERRRYRKEGRLKERARANKITNRKVRNT